MEFYEINDTYSSYLVDEARFIVGNASRIYFPRNTEEVQEIILQSKENNIRVTISGGGTGISGGRVPLGGWILATDKMTKVQGGELWKDDETGIEYSVLLDKEGLLTVPVSMTVKAIQNYCREFGWYYPPDPTERSSFIGGNVNTNASGARSFKYGVTRNWVHKLQVVLPSGDLISCKRGDGQIDDPLIINVGDSIYSIPLPTYELPKTDKNVAGPRLNTDSELVDLFIGSGGMFGVITSVTIRLIRPPSSIANIFAYCTNDESALKLIELARNQRDNNTQPIPLSVEYVDDRAVQAMKKKDTSVPDADSLIILEQEFNNEDEMDLYLEYWVNKLDEFGIDDTSVALEYKEIEHHKDLRHAIPEFVNTLVRKNNQGKLGTDYAIPARHFNEGFIFAKNIGKKFEDKFDIRDKTGYAMWAHAGDSHIHLNFMPKSDEQSHFAKQLMIEFMQYVVSLSGTIAAEHGLGKKKFNNKPAIFYQFGEKGINEILRMKKSLDPELLLNYGNLTDY